MKHNEMLAGRRSFLLAGAGTMAAMGLPRLVLAQGALVDPVTPAINLVRDVGGNVITLDSGDGLLLVDSGSAQATDQLVAALGNKPVHTLINTHWHPDQVGGNAYFGNRGARIIAHKNTQLHLKPPYYLFEEERYHQPMPADAWPEEAVYTSGSIDVGNEEVEYGYLEMAHSNGDLYVRFNNANVIAVGDVVSPVIDPGFDWFSGGWIGGRVDALNRLLDMGNDETRYLPSYGPVIGRADVEAERDMMQFLYDTLVDQIRMGFDYQDSLATGIMDNLPRKLDDPAKFVYDAHKGLWAHHNKLEPNIV